MYNGVPIGSGYLTVYLCDANGGMLEGFVSQVYGNPQAAITVIIRRGNLNNGHIDRPQQRFD